MIPRPFAGYLEARRLQKHNAYFTQQLTIIWQMSITYHGRFALTQVLNSPDVHPVVKDVIVKMIMTASVQAFAQMN